VSTLSKNDFMPDKTIAKELQEQIDKLDAPNIVIVGRTGVGKSSLINAVFGLNIAKVGAGLPITTTFCRYPDEDDDRLSIFVPKEKWFGNTYLLPLLYLSAVQHFLSRLVVRQG
jgi:predicted GTPase